MSPGSGLAEIRGRARVTEQRHRTSCPPRGLTKSATAGIATNFKYVGVIQKIDDATMDAYVFAGVIVCIIAVLVGGAIVHEKTNSRLAPPLTAHVTLAVIGTVFCISLGVVLYETRGAHALPFIAGGVDREPSNYPLDHTPLWARPLEGLRRRTMRLMFNDRGEPVTQVWTPITPVPPAPPEPPEPPGPPQQSGRPEPPGSSEPPGSPEPPEPPGSPEPPGPPKPPEPPGPPGPPESPEPPTRVTDARTHDRPNSDERAALDRARVAVTTAAQRRRPPSSVSTDPRRRARYTPAGRGRRNDAARLPPTVNRRRKRTADDYAPRSVRARQDEGIALAAEVDQLADQLDQLALPSSGTDGEPHPNSVVRDRDKQLAELARRTSVAEDTYRRTMDAMRESHANEMSQAQQRVTTAEAEVSLLGNLLQTAEQEHDAAEGRVETLETQLEQASAFGFTSHEQAKEMTRQLEDATNLVTSSRDKIKDLQQRLVRATDGRREASLALQRTLDQVDTLERRASTAERNLKNNAEQLELAGKRRMEDQAKFAQETADYRASERSLQKKLDQVSESRRLAVKALQRSSADSIQRERTRHEAIDRLTRRHDEEKGALREEFLNEKEQFVNAVELKLQGLKVRLADANAEKRKLQKENEALLSLASEGIVGAKSLSQKMASDVRTLQKEVEETIRAASAKITNLEEEVVAAQREKDEILSAIESVENGAEFKSRLEGVVKSAHERSTREHRAQELQRGLESTGDLESDELRTLVEQVRNEMKAANDEMKFDQRSGQVDLQREARCGRNIPTKLFRIDPADGKYKATDIDNPYDGPVGMDLGTCAKDLRCDENGPNEEPKKQEDSSGNEWLGGKCVFGDRYREQELAAKDADEKAFKMFAGMFGGTISRADLRQMWESRKSMVGVDISKNKNFENLVDKKFVPKPKHIDGVVMRLGFDVNIADHLNSSPEAREEFIAELRDSIGESLRIDPARVELLRIVERGTGVEIIVLPDAEGHQFGDDMEDPEAMDGDEDRVPPYARYVYEMIDERPLPPYIGEFKRQGLYPTDLHKVTPQEAGSRGRPISIAGYSGVGSVNRSALTAMLEGRSQNQPPEEETAASTQAPTQPLETPTPTRPLATANPKAPPPPPLPPGSPLSRGSGTPPTQPLKTPNPKAPPPPPLPPFVDAMKTRRSAIGSSSDDE